MVNSSSPEIICVIAPRSSWRERSHVAGLDRPGAGGGEQRLVGSLQNQLGRQIQPLLDCLELRLIAYRIKLPSDSYALNIRAKCFLRLR